MEAITKNVVALNHWYPKPCIFVKTYKKHLTQSDIDMDVSAFIRAIGIMTEYVLQKNLTALETCIAYVKMMRLNDIGFNYLIQIF